MSMLSNFGKIGSMELKNRMIMAPMGPHIGGINRKAVEYFVRRAEGGVSMIMINMMVTDFFEDTSASLVLTDENFPLFKELCDRAHKVGCKICVQLMPGCGRMAGPAKMYPVPISASECPWLYAPQVKCHELTTDEIGILISETERTVKLAVAAGVDAYEMHAYGGYLNDQFLTAAWNLRTDKYGGDVKGRATFLLEQIAAVRKHAGSDVPVIVKFCPDHCVPLPGMRELDEGIELAKYLEENGVDALHVDAGCYERWQLSMPAVFYQEAVVQLKSAKAVRENVSIPVLTHGRLSNFDKAEAALQNGICDFTVIGRGLLADPDLPEKVCTGCTDDIRPCISCNEGCIGNVMRAQHVTCALNPFTGFEDEKTLKKAERAKKVLVVGAGPGGCAAALLAHKAGHDVELWEKNGSIGGKTLAASAPYMKADMIRLPQYYHTQLVKAGIPVRFYKEATHDTVAAFKPDVLIWAAGGNVVRPASIPGLDRSNVYSCEAALRNQVPIGKKLAIIGGGQVGIEAALHFDRVGHDVTVVEMTDKIMPEPAFVQNDRILREMMTESHGTYLTGTKLVEVNDHGISVEAADGNVEIKCDTVLLAMGWLPDADIAKGFEDICHVLTVGDSNKCRNILSATAEALEAVNNI